jgi:hypothetical protein
MARNTTATEHSQSATKIPRTYKAALKKGYQTSRYSFNDLTDEHKASFVEFEGGRSGSFCGVGPSPDPSVWHVCYKDENGQCHWVDVPRGSPV